MFLLNELHNLVSRETRKQSIENRGVHKERTLKTGLSREVGYIRDVSVSLACMLRDESKFVRWIILSER